MTAAVLSEPIRRVAVDVFPRARSVPQIGYRQPQKTTKPPRILVLVLVERRLPSAENGRSLPSQRNRKATGAAPFAREVPRLDLVKGPFLRRPAFFVATTTSLFGTETSLFGRAIGRERH